MKAIKFLLLLLVLSSCSTIGRYNSIRLVKVDKTETLVLDKEKTNDPVSTREKQESSSPSNNETAQVPQAVTSTINTPAHDIYSEIPQSDHKSIETDDLEPDPEDEATQKMIVEQATRAERNANNAFFSSIVSLVFMILLPIIGVIPFVIGLICHSNASSSRYITPFGESRLKASRIILIVDATILILWILLVVLLIFLI